MQQAAAVGTVRQNPHTVSPSARTRSDQKERAPPPGLRSAPPGGRKEDEPRPDQLPQSDPKTDPRRPLPTHDTPGGVARFLPKFRSPLPEAVKKSGSKNPRHVTIVSMACHYCSACHYCTETERHAACGYCMRHMRADERNSPNRLMPSLRGAAPTQKQATCGASYKRSVQCSVIALLSTCKAYCLLWRYDSP